MSQRTTGQIAEVVTLLKGEEKLVFEVKGPGENLFIVLYTTHDEMKFTILIDNVPMAYGRFRHFRPTYLNTYQGVKAGEGIILCRYETGNAVSPAFGITITLPLKWKVSLVIKGENPDTEQQTIQGSMIYDKLEETPSLDIPKSDVQQTPPSDPKM